MSGILLLVLGVLVGRWVFRERVNEPDPPAVVPIRDEVVREGPRFIVSVDRVS